MNLRAGQPHVSWFDSWPAARSMLGVTAIWMWCWTLSPSSTKLLMNRAVHSLPNMPLWHMINVKLEFRLRQARLLLAVLFITLYGVTCWGLLGAVGTVGSWWAEYEHSEGCSLGVRRQWEERKLGFRGHWEERSLKMWGGVEKNLAWVLGESDKQNKGPERKAARRTCSENRFALCSLHLTFRRLTSTIVDVPQR